jgi:hypothetical protein
MFCKAKATAIDATHKLAIKGVRFTHIFDKKIIIQKAQTTILTKVCTVCCHVLFVCNSLTRKKLIVFIIILQTSKITTTNKTRFII